MKYEIPREAFKQRLEERLNFVLVDLVPEESTPVKFKDVVHISYDTNFKDQFCSKFPSKTQNILIYSLKKDDLSPAKAADELAEVGYHFVYYYSGTPEDVILDKGLN